MAPVSAVTCLSIPNRSSRSDYIQDPWGERGLRTVLLQSAGWLSIRRSQIIASSSLVLNATADGKQGVRPCHVFGDVERRTDTNPHFLPELRCRQKWRKHRMSWARLLMSRPFLDKSVPKLKPTRFRAGGSAAISRPIVPAPLRRIPLSITTTTDPAQIAC